MGRVSVFLTSKARWFWTIGALGAITVAFISGAVIWTSLWTEPARQSIEEARSQSLEAIISANAVESAVLDRQRVMRGRLLTGVRAADIPDLDDARDRIARLAMLVRDEPVQVKRVDELSALVNQQEERIKNSADLVAGGKAQAARLLVEGGVGDRAVEGVRRVVGAIVGAERANLQDLRVEASNIARQSENYTYAIGLICLLVVALGGTAVMVSLRSTWTDRLRDMERLNEERMRIAHEATGAGTWEYGTGQGLVWSPETYLLYGRDARLGVPSVDEWKTMLHPDDLEQCPWTARDVPRGSFAQTFRIVTSSGSWRWIASRGFSFYRDGVDRLVGMDVDVTEQVANREELARLNRLLSQEAASDRRDRELVFEATGDMMAIVSPDGRLTSVNPAWHHVLGWSASELMGKPIADLIASGSEWPTSARTFSADFMAKDGSPRIIEWSVAWDGQGRAIAAGRDVTEQRASEAKLRAAEETVRQMQKMESVGQMTGGIAHDFNNMLTPIFGYLDMLHRRHVDDAKTVRMVNHAMQSAEKARTLVSKLLSFARRQQLEYKVVDAGELVVGMEELVGKSVALPGVEMDVAVFGSPLCVRVDPNQFEMVLMNLAVNARDAMPQGGKIRISVRRAEASEAPAEAGVAAGSYVVVSVEDTGTGMDEETLQRSIEPFYSTKGMGKGTGLGLSMAHGMAGQSGGALVLKSAPGEGTTASVWFPMVDPALMARSAEETSPGSALVERSLRILLVDDDENVRTSIEQMLCEMGHEVKVACSGAEALSHIASDDRIEVLVTDYLMPSMTGGQLIAKAREIHPGLPALIVSGYTNVADQQDLDDSVRLAKPFTSVRLAEALRRISPCLDGGGNVVEMRRRV